MRLDEDAKLVTFALVASETELASEALAESDTKDATSDAQ